MTSYGYDEVGNRISQTDANQHTTTYGYDNLGRRISRKLPAGQSESYTYDAAGNLKTKVDFNGKTTTYAYDTNNRLLSKTPDPSFSAQPISFTYYNNGLRKTMVDPSGTTSYVYDNRNRLQTKQTPEGTLNYTYDNAGDLLTLASGNANGASDTYTYDALNRLSTVVDASGTTTYAYENVGNLQSFAYPNGVTTAYTYDQLNRLTQMGAGKNGALQANYVYTLGAAGNRLSVAELSGRTVNYGYDSLYRLTSETVSADPHGNNGTGSYTYDNVGNRLTLNSSLPPAGMMNYTYDADDRLGSDQYDPNGNTISSAGTSSTYDFENHLVAKGGVTIVYDGDGNRVSETVAGVTTQYLVDTQNQTGYAQVVDEIQNGSVIRAYSWGLELISKLETGNSKRSFYGFDGHGSVRFLTDATGNVTDTYDYDAFGNLINQTGSTPNNYLFAGEQYDPALGLYYNRARYLNTTTGRFWSMDTYEGDATSPGSLHKYLYAEGNPVDHLDPSGHEIDEILEVATIAVALVSMSSCTRGPTQQPITVEPIEYAQSSYGNGVHIEIGARLLLRIPHFAEYRWVQKVTTNATDPKDWNIMPPGSEYVDPQPHREAGDFFYTKAEEAGQHSQRGYDYVFEDTPHRKLPSSYPYLQGRPVSWKANLYLVGVNPPGSTSYTKIIQITYGFRVFESGNVDADPMHATRLLPSQQQLF